MWLATISVIDLCVGLHLSFEDLDGVGIGSEIRLGMPSTGDVQQVKVMTVSERTLVIKDWYDREWLLTPRAGSTMLPNQSAMLPAHWVIRKEL